MKDKEIIIMGNLGEGHKDNIEEDVFVEIIKANDEVQGKMTEEEYDAVFKKLNDMRPVLNDGQIAKLDRVLELLNRDV